MTRAIDEAEKGGDTVRIHAIQTGTVAIKSRQVRGEGHGALRRLNTLRDKTWTEPLPIFAWAIEHPEGVIVVDTGETARTAEPRYFPQWHPYYRNGVRAWVVQEQEIGPRLLTLGIEPRDVRWVVLTHLHTDHAGGLHHFPNSEILVSGTELADASGWQGRVRGYLPNHWPDFFTPRTVSFDKRPLGPFSESYSLTQTGDVLLIPTPGHTKGHLSVIVREDNQSIFLAGDTSYTEQAMLDQAVDGVAPDVHTARQTLAHIRDFTRETPLVYLPSHDPASARRLAVRQTVTQAASVVTRPS